MGIKRSSRPPIIRMFPDYADTVLWMGDPLDYSETALSAQLVAALRAWEESYYESLDRHHDFRSEALKRNYTLEGVRLAGMVAAEVGSGFAVEFHSPKKWSRQRLFRSGLPATNPAAARRLGDLHAAAQAEARDIEAMVKDGRVYFHAPISDTIFVPRRRRFRWLRR